MAKRKKKSRWTLLVAAVVGFGGVFGFFTQNIWAPYIQPIFKEAIENQDVRLSIDEIRFLINADSAWKARIITKLQNPVNGNSSVEFGSIAIQFDSAGRQFKVGVKRVNHLSSKEIKYDTVLINLPSFSNQVTSGKIPSISGKAIYLQPSKSEEKEFVFGPDQYSAYAIRPPAVSMEKADSLQANLSKYGHGHWSHQGKKYCIYYYPKNMKLMLRFNGACLETNMEVESKMNEGAFIFGNPSIDSLLCKSIISKVSMEHFVKDNDAFRLNSIEDEILDGEELFVYKFK